MTGQGPDSDRAGPVDHTRTTLSPREAAHLVGVGRSSIMRAIAAGELPARRDNRNQWQIEREALDRWRSSRPDHDRTTPIDHDRTPDRTPDRAGPDQIAALTVQLTDALAQAARERVRSAQLEARLDERAAVVRLAEDRARSAERDRDHWRDQVEALTVQTATWTAALTRPAPPSPRRWWQWWPRK